MTPASIRRCSRHPRGLSLVQLMVVIFIIGLLMAMTVGGIAGMKNVNAANTTKATMAVLDGALTEFKNSTGEYPRIAGTPVLTCGSLTGSNDEISWMNTVITQFNTVDQNVAMLAKLGRFKETRTTAFDTKLSNFRNTKGNALPVAINSNEGTAPLAALEVARLAAPGASLTFIRDGWDRPIYYFPSDTASTDTAATLRPLFASAGRDGKLQSFPWSATASYVIGSTVYYKQRWYEAKVAGVSAVVPSDSSSNWQEVTSDDFVTRGN